MTTRMLIDARHPEETRVAVVQGTRIEEFDFEAADRKQLKGNIYLAKVTRVEPSLQAAFIEYGGNRHGFLAFSEIHPDYYQIPREDRERLLREERALEEEAAEEREEADEDAPEPEPYENGDANGDAPPPPRPVETGGADDHHGDRLRERRMALRRRYKIQDVIKRRQVLLVQVVKEERGNKGAALTTYLSLAGRYCVLMPNTSHGGGISRKISSAADRKRLKSIMDELKLPPGMAAIVRTAGLARTKTEIRRDFDYLTRLWDDIREATLASTAPALIHEDSDLIKRAIRDIYGRDIEEVLVEGEAGYRHAREFMKLLMPTHAKRVKQYVDPVPLFQRGQVEGQLNAMFQPVVQLRSGGYLVINQTEALVAIDINSGRSTREHNIEETAYKTNCEAADEIARQLRLRDLAGLIVVDFIDMEHQGNVRRVERAMKEALKNDRARIQVGRISGFGLLEMSRQRLRTGVLEASTHACPACEGSGWVRSVPSAALAAIRALEEEAVRGRHALLTLRAAEGVAVYVLNRKRAELAELEDRYGVRVEVTPDAELNAGAFAVDGAGGPPERDARALAARPMIVAEDEDDALDEDEAGEEFAQDADEPEPEIARADGRDRAGEERRGRKRRRRRGGRRGEGRTEADAGAGEPLEAVPGDDGERPDGAADTAAAEERAGERGGRRRRRGRRGGRRPEGEGVRAGTGEDEALADVLPVSDEVDGGGAPEEAEAGVTASEPTEPAAPEPQPEAAPAKPARRARAKKADAAPADDDTAEPAKKPRGRKKADAPAPEAAPAEEADAPAPKPARKPRARKTTAPEADGADAPDAEPTAAGPATAEGASAGPPVAAEASAPARKGWWQRTFG